MRHYLLYKEPQDSCQNILGINYSVFYMTEEYLKDLEENGFRRTVVQEGDEPSPGIKRLKVIKAYCDIDFYHLTALMECFDFARKDAESNGDKKFRLDVSL